METNQNNRNRSTTVDSELFLENQQEATTPVRIHSTSTLNKKSTSKSITSWISASLPHTANPQSKIDYKVGKRSISGSSIPEYSSNHLSEEDYEASDDDIEVKQMMEIITDSHSDKKRSSSERRKTNLLINSSSSDSSSDEDNSEVGNLINNGSTHSSPHTTERHLRHLHRAQAKYPLPDKRFLFQLPDSFERFFFSFDDKITRFCQKLKGKVVSLIAMMITGIVAIEIGFCAPFVLFILGWDALASELSYLMLFLALFSQIPKRFIWRYRPYMVERADQYREKESATTSSFPSRAVTCATVYAFVLCYAYATTIHPSSSSSGSQHVHLSIGWVEWWMPFVVIISAIIASWARITLGVHYPSDCLFGFIQGVLVCVLATIVGQAGVAAIGCPTCIDRSMCYQTDTKAQITLHHWERINWLAVGISSAASVLLAAVSMAKPIDFWDKCDRVYGLLLPGLVFQWGCICPLHRWDWRALPPPPTLPTLWAPFFALSVIGLALGLTYALQKCAKRHKVAAVGLFFLLFCLLLFSLLLWRTSPIAIDKKHIIHSSSSI